MDIGLLNFLIFALLEKKMRFLFLLVIASRMALDRNENCGQEFSGRFNSRRFA
jgi:hypothetical protein